MLREQICKIRLFSLVNSTTAEGERGNSEYSRIDVPDIEPRNETNICKIFKVPEHFIHEDNKHSFKPKILSIGPYNYGSSRLEEMERVKLICRGHILGPISVNYYDTGKIQELQNQARSFYSENIAMEPKSFARMLLLDGCFILAALIEMKGRVVENISSETAMSSQGTTSSDTLEPEEGGQWQGDLNQHEALHRHDILHDLLLVENQIPFFVLEEIHKIAVGEGETTEPLKKEIATRVERVLQQYPKAISISEICEKDFHHLVHLCHMFFRPSPNSVERHNDQAVINQWHRAMEYHEAGVKFRVKPSPTGCSLLDVTFSKGTMEIPHLYIDANTESIFSNLILFELSGCPHAGNYISAYITFMSKLLSNNEDVELLVRGGIIEKVGHHEEILNEILNLFSRLNRLVVYPYYGKDNYLESTLRSVEAHYRWRPIIMSMAWLKHNYLTNPLVVLTEIGSFIVLLCTVIQTVFTVLQFFTQPK